MARHREKRQRGRQASQPQPLNDIEILHFHLENKILKILGLASIHPPPGVQGKGLTDQHRLLVRRVATAICNPIFVDWDFEDFSSSTAAAKLRNFRSPNLGVIDECATIVDCDGRIIAWILPKILSRAQLNVISTSTKILDKKLASSIKKEKPSSSEKPMWRSLASNFRRRSMQPGAVNFSGGWFGTGHASSQYPLKPSVNLKSRAAKEWLIEMNDLEENFIDLILALTHPSLFKAGVEAYERRESEIPSESHNIMHSWRSVFSGIAVIVNRKSARHTDRGGRRHWYDLLISAGNPARPVLKLPQLGAKITYTAGTVVLLCGKSIEHEVGDWGAGDRICLAHFMRDNVFRRLGVDHAEWSLLPAIVDRVKRGNLDTD